MRQLPNLALWITSIEVALLIGILSSSGQKQETTFITFPSQATLTANVPSERFQKRRNQIRHNLFGHPLTTGEPVKADVDGRNTVLTGSVSDDKACFQVLRIAGRIARADEIVSPARVSETF